MIEPAADSRPRSVSSLTGQPGLNDPCHTFTGGVDQHSGNVLSSPAVVAVYWGDYVSAHQDVRIAFDQFFAELLGGDFMDSLAQYGVGEARFVMSATVAGSPSPIHPSDVTTNLQSWMDSGTVVTPASAGDAVNWLYVIVAPPGSDVRDNGDSSTVNLCGYHQNSSFTFAGTNANVAWAIVAFSTPSAGAQPVDVVNSVAYCLGHETVEAMSNPRGQGWYATNGCEIGDLCETHTFVDVGRWSVETYWSNGDSGCAAGANVDWSSLGTPGLALLGSPSVHANADDRLEVFAVTNDGQLWHVWQTAANNGWSPWAPLAGTHSPFSSSLIVGSNADGRLEVFGMGLGGEVFQVWQTAANNGWSGFASLGSPPGGVVGAARLASNADGRIEVFAVGADQTLWHVWQTAPNDGWSAWASLGAPGGTSITIGDPRIGRNADGRLEAFVVATDGGLYHVWQTAPNDGWSAWAGFPAAPAGIANGAPVVASNADGRLEVFATGSDGSLYHLWQMAPNDGWSGWAGFASPFGMQLFGLAAAGSNADGRIEVFAVGSDGALWHVWQTSPNNGWSNWHFLDGAPRGQAVNADQAPAVGSNADGRLEVFLLGADGALWHAWQMAPNGVWGTLVTS